MAGARSSSTRSLGYLPSVDGLRAVSVVAVLLWHARLTWLPGGFLGVEVFFVISGYLITLLLLTEHDTAGRIALGRFWLRRARRLLPALFTVITVSVVVTSLFFRDHLAALRGQVLAALTYCTNWYDIVGGHSYFTSEGVLRHLWSLAVEEQFYLVWPLLLVGLVTITRNRRLPLTLIILGGAAASALAMAALYRPGQLDQTRIYEGTHTRAAGLLLGAALAVLWRPKERRPTSPVVIDGVAIAGTAGIVLCFLKIGELDRFLYRGGFTLTAGLTLVVIAAAVHPSAVVSKALLGNGVMTWIGLRSYGIYLWHWPIFVLTQRWADQTDNGPAVLALRLAMTAVVAEASFRFVEMPIRSGTWRAWFERLTPDRRHRLAMQQLLVAGGVLLIAAAGPLATVSDVGHELAVGGSAPVTTTTSAANGDGTSAGAPTDVTSTTAPDQFGGGTATSAPAPVTPTSITVITDSVLLRIQDAFTAKLQALGWKVDYRGKSALMLDKALQLLTDAGTPVGDVVVVGLGYNSLWEKDRANFDSWAARFDREANELLDTMRALGAKRFVWVTLREPDRDIIPKSSAAEYQRYAWYFPYVNERLRLLAGQRQDVTLADWAAISNVAGITGDLIHLNTKGFDMMTDLIIHTIGG